MHEQSAAEMPSDEGGHALQSKASPAWGGGSHRASQVLCRQDMIPFFKVSKDSFALLFFSYTVNKMSIALNGQQPNPQFISSGNKCIFVLFHGSITWTFNSSCTENGMTFTPLTCSSRHTLKMSLCILENK